MLGHVNQGAIDNTSIGGVKVLLIGSKCHLSYGIFVATLDEANRDGKLWTRFKTAHIPISPHGLQLINQWANARGYTKERHVINPPKDRRRIRTR